MSWHLGYFIVAAGIAMGFVGKLLSGSDMPDEDRRAALWFDFGVLFVVAGALVWAGAALAALRGGS
ncbi:MAG: hypothetical protein ACLPGW_19495 [Roseiarcus sp.]